MIARLLAAIGPANQWCVEFGAWDGKLGSNTYSLLQDGWHGVLIEADPDRFAGLTKNYAGNPRAVCINSLVGWEGSDRLDALLGRTEIPADFDLLSIDIDGNDFHVWRGLKDFQPRLVVIEYNSSIPDEISFVQPADPRLNHGSSLRALTELAATKGYELAATTALNAFFVRADEFPKLGIEDNSLAAMRTDRSLQTYVFQLYDGTVVWQGNDRLAWASGVRMPLHRLQVLPRFLRFLPQHDIGVIRRAARKVYLSVRGRLNRRRSGTS